MPTEELLKHWLISLYSNLKKVNKEVADLEKRSSYAKELNELQLSKLDIWLSDKNIDSDVKEDLEQSKDLVRKIPENDEHKLKRLRKQQKSSNFMISEIEKELRG